MAQMPMGKGPMPMEQEGSEMDMQEDAAEQGAGGPATQLVSSINDNMIQLLGGLAQMQDIPQESKQKLAMIVKAFQSFVSEDLGSGPKAPQAAPKKAAGGVTTPEAGAASVEPA